ncbi:MAG TPA: CHAT domain-containing protein [Pseudomonadota bacterium]|nr:CHAT domain-containing protein [Pseudomonadota bacterium]
MSLPTAPPAPAVLLHTLDRWLEQQADRLDPDEFARLLDRLRPHLPLLEAALADWRLGEFVRCFEALAIELNAAELVVPLRNAGIATGQTDAFESTRGVSDPPPENGAAESGHLLFATPPLRTLLDRVQQMVQPRQVQPSTSLAISSPPAVALHQPFSVDVQAGLSPAGRETTAVNLPLPAAGPLDFETELLLDDPAAFEFRSGAQGLLRVLPDGRSARLSFLLVAKQAGSYRLTVIFRQHGVERRRISRPLAVATPDPSIEVESVAADSPPPPEPILLTPGPAPRGIVLRLRRARHAGPQPVFIGELFGPGLRHAPLSFEVPLDKQIEEASAEFCRRIGDLTDLPTDLESELRVRALGEWLARLFLRDEPRQILDSPDIPDGTPLHIESHDLWVPWELLLLNDRRSGHELFLGEKFAVSRWTDAGSAREAVGEGGVTLVSPTDPGLSVGRERRVLAGLRAGGLSELSSLAEVQRLLNGQAPCGVLHFACHADNTADRVAPDYLILKDEVLLRPFDVPAARNDVVRALDGGLVFINACQSAIESPSMARDRGWARAFIGGGAAALVACAWTVKNGTAARFAEEFYRQARLGVTLAEAARQARCRVRPLGEHESLGYALYAAPEARLVSL